MAVATTPSIARLVAIGLSASLAVSACSTLGSESRSGVERLEPGVQPVHGAVVGSMGGLDATRAAEIDATPAAELDATRAAEPSAIAPPPAHTIRLKPRPRPGPFKIDLYEAGDFMHQQTKDWCAAGATQTMMNIIDPGEPNRSARLQRRLYNEGRRLSHNQQKLGAIGMDLTGWMELLNTHGYGPYVVDSGSTRMAAIRKAAKAIRMTGKPVGIVTWRGAHAWVMSGFNATADPAYRNDFQVKSVFIQDVWYPYVSTIWGASRPPGAAVPVSALAEDYLPYRRPSARYPKRDGRFMLILPVLPPDTVVR